MTHGAAEPRSLELEISTLHLHHPGIASEIADGYAMTAAVCMSRHHTSPKDWAVQMDSLPAVQYQVTWPLPSAAAIRSCANDQEATRDGAYCLALAAADAHLSLVALRRSEQGSGADFYLIPVGASVSADPHLDFERADLVRLEVSGIDDDDDPKMRQRIREKVEQAATGRSPFPAVAGIVGFRTARVVFRRVRDSHVA